jgi:O-antigen/teichoic acid export membrane protein
MSFRKNAFKVGLGTILAQTISSATLLIVPQLYEPSEFGQFITVLALCSIFLPFATLKIEVLSTVAKSELDSEFLFWFVRRLAIFVSGMTFLITSIYFWITMEVKFVKILLLSLSVAFIVLAQSFAIIKVQMRIRDQNLGKVAVSGIVQNGTTLGSQIILTFFSRGSLSLVLGYLIGRSSAIYALGVVTTAKVKYRLDSINRKTLRDLILPGRHLFFASVLDAITLSIPVLYVGNFFESDYVGKVGLLQSIMLVPVSLAGIVISSMLFSRTKTVRLMGFKGSQEWFKGQLGKSYNLAIVIFSACSIIVGPWMLETILSDRWQIPPELIITATLSAFSILIFIPTSNILIVYGHFRIVRNFALTKNVAAFLSMGICYWLKFDWIASVSIYYVTQALASLGILYFCRSRLVL